VVDPERFYRSGENNGVERRMDLKLLKRKLKSIAQQFELRINKKLKRYYIPRYIKTFNIETSGLCNLKCRFCAYSKKKSQKKIMHQDLFEKVVNEAVNLGYNDFELTPCTGDVFADPGFLDKLRFLETDDKVETYSFFTNFILPNNKSIYELSNLEKLKSIVISVYGHDEDSFVRITQSTSRNYRKLISNLNFLLEHIHSFNSSIGIGFRSERVASRKNFESDISNVLEKLRIAGIDIMESHGIYNNWGGYVSQEDVKGLDIVIMEKDFYPKIGACSKIFDSVQVTSSGIVNACNCRDVDSQLMIGNINEMQLANVLSPLNLLYRNLIDEQENNRFRPVCRNCDYYRSVYHQPQIYRKNSIETISIADFISRPYPKDRK